VITVYVYVQFCMVCSTGYHVFRCHSEKANVQWLALDMTGISVGILGCYLPAVHLGFYCLSVSSLVFVLFGSVIICNIAHEITKEFWYNCSERLGISY